MATTMNPYTKKAGANYYYYYYNVPGTYTLSVPIKGISLYCVVAGGGGMGGSVLPILYTCAYSLRYGGGGGGSGGKVIASTLVSSSELITINVGDIGQNSSIVYMGTTITANAGNNGSAGYTQCYAGSSSKFFLGWPTGGAGASDLDGNPGGTWAYTFIDNIYSYDKYADYGANASGSAGGGGGAALWSGTRAGGKGGPGKSITFMDGTGTGYVNPGGDGGTGGSVISNGMPGPKGSVLIYFYSDGCWSPFSYFNPSGKTLFLSENIVKIRGQYTLQGYTTPSVPICMYWPKISCPSCYWKGWRGWELVCPPCSTDWTNWCCCWSIPGIPLYPDIHFDVRCDLPLTLQVTQEGFKIPAITPASEILTAYILIGNTDMYIDIHLEGISDDTYTLKLINQPTYVPCQDNFYSSVVALPSWEYKIVSGLYTYEADISADLEFCAKPDSQDMWINCPLYITLDIYDNITKISSYKNTWVINVKIAEIA